MIFIFFFHVLSFSLISIIGYEGLQISNFIFFFLITFELCIKIGQSEKFADWIGSALNENF
ncbi:hypothetical protein OA848_01265, partial [Rickettsiales bacterium]|nr:hypothetical protein [Rickettsiales bacterium]